ncbi:succinate-semialdehyde dehydrogenase/glutarate-semialdehyde dehydrogenase [Bacillus niacini]|uniref:3-sulfolactaldehyde dehydrogenase n=1 Tax=Neobacillus niacini TaxID=86668 RepID=A0A852TAC6_9BACI|nr:aldehyde dehydrogenase family protein [Neobacillus niacini]NYE05740.1 succinate-semialdehyde dehydrogenase/glutarate-semialdehyde dehydrogenase [Neobacillus niacini]
MAIQTNTEVAKLLIGGQWVESTEGKYLETYNPATGEVVGKVPEGTIEDIHKAVAAAKQGQPALAALSLFERSALLNKIANALELRKEEIARVCSLEEGKPLYGEAIFEVGAAVQGFRNAAEQVKYLEGTTIPVEGKTKKAFNFYQPKGIYAVITPFNFPVNIPVEYIGPNIAAGNAIVWVPAPTTALTGLKLAEVIQSAGIPDGVLNVVTGKGEVIGDELVGHPDINGIGFTGSTPTGNIISRRGAGKHQVMELGGNGPTIVLEDADVAKAAESIFYGCFVNAGQTCSSTERILIHESLQDEFVEKLLAKVQAEIKLGDPLLAETTMGPLHNEGIASKMDAHVQDAIAKGAELVYGGKRASGYSTNLYYEPTILKNCSQDSLVNLEETFGPIAPIVTFKTKEEAIEIARQGNFGLLASVFTESSKNAFFFIENLKHGIVNINEHSNYWELHIPFGGGAGTKSGQGRIGGKQLIEAMSNLKTVIWELS